MKEPYSDTVAVELGDIVVSKFGNRWRCEAWQRVNGELLVVLRNRLQEAPEAQGTVYSGPLPEWADRIERDGLRVWQRPTPKCECPAYAQAKGPYPSGFCPDCGEWFPGITRAQAITPAAQSSGAPIPQVDLPADAAKVLREHAWELLDNESPYPSGAPETPSVQR